MGANDQGLMQQGFVTTTIDAVVNWTRTGSLWPMTFGLAYAWKKGVLEWAG